MKRFLLLAAGCSLCVSSGKLSAQNAQLSGFVSDASGRNLVGASVAITDLATQATQRTDTNRSGIYAFPILPANRYRLTVQAPGFRTEAQEGVVLTVAQSAQINVHLQIRETSEQVTVSAGSVELDAASATVSSTIESRQFTELPLLGRNPYTLVELSPGVVVHGNAGTGPSINGGRSKRER